MAIVKSVLFNELRGKIKQLEFRFRRNRKIELSMKRIPAYTRTDAQDKIRTRYGQLVQEWKQLSEEERKQYEAEARKHGISGWNYFVMVKMPVTGLEFDNGGGEIWHRYINAAISSATAEDAVYIILFDDTNVAIQNVEGTEKISAAIASDFWSNVKDDGSDIRPFDQDKRQLYFFVESFDYTNKQATIWVKLPSGSTELNIAYGNPSATKSDYEDPEQVFEFFDDFEGSELDTTKWQTSGTFDVLEVVNGELHAIISQGSSIIVSKASFGRNIIIEDRARLISREISQAYLVQDIDNRIVSAYYYQNDWYQLISKTVGGSATTLVEAHETLNYNTYYFRRTILKESDIVYELYDDNGNLITTLTASDTTFSSGYVGFKATGDTTLKSEFYADWIRVLKLADPADFSSMQIITL